MKRKIDNPDRSRVKRFAAQVAGAQLGFIYQNVPGAVTGAVYAGRAYDYRYPEQIEASDDGTVSQKNNSMGYYAGHLGKFKNPKKTATAVALRKGYHVTNDDFGEVKDPNAVYITHSTYNVYHYSAAIRGALLRKLFKLAGIEISEPTEEMALFSAYNSDGFKLQYETKNPLTGALAVWDYVTLDNESFFLVLSNFTFFRDHILSCLGGTNTTEPYALRLYASDRNVLDTNWRLMSQLMLPSEKITIHSSSEIKIQNRTLGANAPAGNENVDRVDNQPVAVKTYLFKHGDPRLKAPNFIHDNFPSLVTLGGIPESYVGVRLIRSAQLINTNWQNAPDKGIFTNCSMVKGGLLQAGQMKSSFISASHRGLFNTVMKKLRPEFPPQNGLIAGVQGKCELMLFSEKMRTAAANSIAISYERELKVGCILTTTKPVPWSTSFTSFQNDNVPT
nr:putative capsid protein [Cressdnaviricota sp.]